MFQRQASSFSWPPPHLSSSRPRGKVCIRYALVNIEKTIENGHWNGWFIHQTWWCSLIFHSCLSLPEGKCCDLFKLNNVNYYIIWPEDCNGGVVGQDVRNGLWQCGRQFGDLGCIVHVYIQTCTNCQHVLFREHEWCMFMPSKRVVLLSIGSIGIARFALPWPISLILIAVQWGVDQSDLEIRMEKPALGAAAALACGTRSTGGVGPWVFCWERAVAAKQPGVDLGEKKGW